MFVLPIPKNDYENTVRHTGSVIIPVITREWIEAEAISNLII